MSGHKLIIGKFRYDQYGILRGHVGVFGLGSVDVMSQEVVSLKGTTYMRLIADPAKLAYEIGSAFPKENSNGKYFTVNLDTPFLAAPIRAALFRDRNDEGLYNMIWNRDDTHKPSPT